MVFRPDSRGSMSDFKDFTPDLIFFRSNFKDHKNFKE